MLLFLLARRLARTVIGFTLSCHRRFLSFDRISSHTSYPLTPHTLSHLVHSHTSYPIKPSPLSHLISSYPASHLILTYPILHLIALPSSPGPLLLAARLRSSVVCYMLSSAACYMWLRLYLVRCYVPVLSQVSRSRRCFGRCLRHSSVMLAVFSQ